MHFITGLHINVGKRNFHYQIPGQDLQYFSGFEDGYYLENKELWETLSIPMNFQFSIGSQPKKNLRGIIGINLKYSGFMSDEVITSTIYSVNGNSQIFEINLSSNNNGKVWFTINVGLSRSFILDNHNELAIGLLMDLSLHSFYKGSYQFTLPGKPISAGFYSIKGSGIGLSLQYIFKGVNKKEAKKYIR